MEIIETTRIPIYSWATSIDAKALWQAKNLAALPFTHHHIGLMADCHEGYGMPIGGVVACEGHVIPNAVGVDIGCGIRALKTDFNAEALDIEMITKILRDSKRYVPIGFHQHYDRQFWSEFDNAPDIPVVQSELNQAQFQLGSLGGGNHFIELDKDSEGKVWIMIHSGSRNLGYKIARVFHDQACWHCDKKNLFLPDVELAYLPLGTAEAQEYLVAMEFAMDFARENRLRIADQVLDIARHYTGLSVTEELNVFHNYAAIEEHFEKNVVVHRKGASLAKDGTTGLIPGSMGSPSYIVKGKGVADAFLSCAHGAGRSMSRHEANKRINVDQAMDRMKGIVFDRFPRNKLGYVDVSEAPQAYKNIDEVMAQQTDLVEIINKLTPLGVIKG